MKKLLLILILAILSLATSGAAYGQSPLTEPSGGVREKVEEKVNQVLKVPRAYIGTITDISETTLQLSKYIFNPETEKSGEIQQVSITPDTTYVNSKAAAKTIKFQDIAIGDFVIAMGYANGNSVLQSTRVLIIEILKPTAKASLYLTVVTVNKSSLEASSPVDNKSYTIKPASKAKISTTKDGEDVDLNLSDIKKASKIIVVGTLANDALEARKIYVLPQEETKTIAPSTNASPVSTEAPNQ
jgi:hypothetical protein